MRSYPILFGYRDMVADRDFVAFVATDGRALCTREADGFWLYGVDPGSIAGGGESVEEAGRALKESYLSALFDIAAEAASFAAFKKEVERFFAERNGPNEAMWEAAHALVKSGAVDGDAVAGSLPRKDAALCPRGIRIEQVDTEHRDASQHRFNTFVQQEYAEAA